MADQSTTDRIIFLSIFGISMLFGLFTLIIALKNRFYKQLLSEFMIYVMVSEIIYAVSRFFCLTRENIDEVLGKNLYFNMTQIFASVGCDLCTLLTTLFISFKIIDGILNSSKMFSLKITQYSLRIIIFFLSFGLAIIICFIQVYVFESDLYNEKHLLCNVLSCQLSADINVYVVYFIIALTFLILLVIVVAIIYLNVQLMLFKKQNTLNSRISSNINSMQFKLWIYPIVSCAFWAWRFIYQAVSLGTVPNFVIWLYSISNGLRTSIYSLVFILSNNELMVEFKNFFSVKQKNDNTVDSSSEERSDNILMESQIIEIE